MPYDRFARPIEVSTSWIHRVPFASLFSPLIVFSLHRDVLHQVELFRVSREQELAGGRIVRAFAQRAAARGDRVVDQRQTRFVLFDQFRIETIALFGDRLIQQPDRFLILVFGARDLPVHQLLIGQLTRRRGLIGNRMGALRRVSILVWLPTGGDAGRRRRGRRRSYDRRRSRSGLHIYAASEVIRASVAALQVERGRGHRQRDEQRGESRLPQRRGREQAPERAGAQPLQPTGAALDQRLTSRLSVDAGADRLPHLARRL